MDVARQNQYKLFDECQTTCLTYLQNIKRFSAACESTHGNCLPMYWDIDLTTMKQLIARLLAMVQLHLEYFLKGDGAQNTIDMPVPTTAEHIQLIQNLTRMASARQMPINLTKKQTIKFIRSEVQKTRQEKWTDHCTHKKNEYLQLIKHKSGVSIESLFGLFGTVRATYYIDKAPIFPQPGFASKQTGLGLAVTDPTKMILVCKTLANQLRVQKTDGLQMMLDHFNLIYSEVLNNVPDKTLSFSLPTIMKRQPYLLR